MFLKFLVLSAITHLISCAWDPDAGLVTSWTKKSGVTSSATSGDPDTTSLVLDGNDRTHWTSASCLPLGYLPRADTNVLFGLCLSSACLNGGTPDPELRHMTDGNVYTASHMSVGQDGLAKVRLDTNGRQLTNLSVWGSYNGNTNITVVDRNGVDSTVYTLDSQDNYREIRVPIPPNPQQISLESHSKFMIKEISGLGPNGCHQRIIVDLGAMRRIGVVRTRHWAGNDVANSAHLIMSTDGQHWDTINALQPSALQAVTSRVDPPVVYRYIAIDYDLKLKNYNKVYCWEIDAFDEFGIWGAAPNPKPNLVSLRQLLGVNGIWGWGHQKYSNDLSEGQGPTLYNEVASHARNYHNLNWDVQDPDFDPEFENMGEGHGTNASWWLNWDTEYRAWVAANLTVDASIQFNNNSFNDPKFKVWDNPSASAYNYGLKFASHFGPQIGNGYVSAIEVGNEPWSYSADFYATVLSAMTAGVREVDNKMDVLPGAFQAYTIAPSEPVSGNYIGSRVRRDVAANISVINTHAYSYVINETGSRVATYPEHPDSNFHAVHNMIRWRDANTPCKPIWLTEWGWDADGGQENCATTECVTELAQAVYGVRGLFQIARLGIERATWFFYANTNNCNTLYCRSGLTTSVAHAFAKKSVFRAFQVVLDKLGDKHFIGVLNEDADGYVYLFGTATRGGIQRVTNVVAWLPIEAENATITSRTVTLPYELRPVSAHRMTKITLGVFAESLPVVHGRSMVVTLTTMPLIVEMSAEVTEPFPVVG